MVALFVVLTVGCFLLVDLAVAAHAKSRAAQADRYVAGFELARDRVYHAGHTWAKRNNAGAVVGLDHFGARLVGAPEAVNLPELGARVEAGRPLATLVRRGRRTLVVAPISGRVAAVNRRLEHAPQALWSDPYGGGWLAEIEGDDVAVDLRKLRDGKAARAWLDESALALHQIFAPQGALPAAADGGRPVDSVSDLTDDEGWRRICGRFLLTDGE